MTSSPQHDQVLQLIKHSHIEIQGETRMCNYLFDFNSNNLRLGHTAVQEITNSTWICRNDDSLPR